MQTGYFLQKAVARSLTDECVVLYSKTGVPNPRFRGKAYSDVSIGYVLFANGFLRRVGSRVHGG
jgi:hypothetical protein